MSLYYYFDDFVNKGFELAGQSALKHVPVIAGASTDENNEFFIELNTAAPVPAVVMPAARDYLSFSVDMLKVFGVAFQLPLVLVLLNRVGVLSRARAIKMRRYVIVLIVIIAAVLTPPDVVSQILLALPMWGLFEASLIFMRDDKLDNKA